MRQYIIVIFCAFIFALGVNLFVVPLDLFAGGVLGVAQISRTLIENLIGQVSPSGIDMAGIINFAINIPLFFLAFRTMSKSFFVKTLLSVLFQTIFLTLIPIPSTPLIGDVLSNCIIGGGICGIGIGLTLRASACGGGLDILGVYFTKKFDHFSVGKLTLMINAFIYLLCAVLFDLETALYSIIYMASFTLVLDRAHYQNINVTCMVFSKVPHIQDSIMSEMARGVTIWEGYGAYSGEDTQIMLIVINKYEINQIKSIVRSQDSEAFIVFFEGNQVSGNFEKRL